MNSSDPTMLPHASFTDIPVAQNVKQMLAFDDQSFLYCAYRTLIRRDPDEVGMSYYLGRLRGGETKMQILKELSASAEGRRISANVAGLEASISRHKIARMFGIGRPPAVNQQLASQSMTVPEVMADTVSAPDAIPDASPKAISVVRIPIPENLQLLETEVGSNTKQTRALWVDLTTSTEWTEGFAGVIRTELQIAYGLHKLDKNVKFCVQVENGFAEIKKTELLWLLDAPHVSNACLNIYDSKYEKNESSTSNAANTPKSITVYCDINSQLAYPFNSNDIYLAISKPNKDKESLISKVKTAVPTLLLGNYINDTAPLAESTKFNFPKKIRNEYLDHIRWCSNASDFLIYGTGTGKKEITDLQKKMKWRSPRAEIVKPGAEEKPSSISATLKETLSRHKISSPYIFASASLVPEENYETIYKAFKMVLSNNKAKYPQLVICSQPMAGVNDLLDNLKRDPSIKGHITQITASAAEQEILRTNSLFVINPGTGVSSMESLHHSLASGKTSLNVDTDYTREIGQDLVEYIPLLDVRKWADKIAKYSVEKNLISSLEKNIKENHKTRSWNQTADEILSVINIFAANAKNKIQLPSVWLDVSTSYLYWEGGVAGIIRAELTFAKYLRDISPDENNVHFFASSNNKFFEIAPERLQWLFDSKDLVQDYKWFQEFWKNHHIKRDPFFDGPPAETDSRILNSFPDNSIVLFTCIDWNMYQSRVKAAVDMKARGKNILLSQLIYDMTPFLVPHLHQQATCDGFVPFVEYVSNHFDQLIYGGKTAMRDTIAIQKENGWNTPISDSMEFGSDIQTIKENNQDEATLLKYGIHGRFLLTVGTIEPRKNHETLYKAYLMLLSESDRDRIPTLVIVGKRGWKFDDFLTAFENDDRIKGKIIFISPSDMELDVLYRRCFFTLLPSFYEGWSLTLPESLGYGKFCLTSKVDPLIETGGSLVDYIDPLDTAEWARKIFFYSTHPLAIKEKEENIHRNWSPKSWFEATQSLFDLVNQAHRKIAPLAKIEL
jgi:glycosyltransferase involved in cell wall biosynthesis